MNNLLLFLVFIGSASLNLGLSIYGWRRRYFPGAKMFGLAALLFTIWPLVQAIDLTTSDLTLKIVLMKSRIDAPVFGGIAWLVMVTQLTGQSHLINKRWLAIICSIPILTPLLNLTSYSELFRHSYYLETNGTLSILHWSNGPLFWVWFVWGYAVFLAPFFVLVRAYQNISTLSAQQGRIVLVALVFPLLINLLFQFGITPVKGLNLTPATFFISGAIIAWAVFRYHLFNIVPIARGLLIENIRDGVIVLDNLNNVVDINPAMLKLIGIDMGAALGKNIETVFAPWPDILATFRDVNETQTEISIEGNPRQYFDLHISPLYGRGKWEAGRIVVVRNVTKYKKVENALRLQSAALNATANAVVITDNHTVIQWVNPAFTQLTGYSEKEAVGETPKIIRSGKHNPEFYRAMYEIPKSGQAWKGEVINRRKDGTEYFEEQTITPVQDKDGNITHFIAIKQDVTARKQAEDKLLEKETQIRALNDNLPNGYTYQLDFGVHGEIKQFLYISAGVEKIFDISTQQILDDPTCLSERFLEEDNNKIAEIEKSAFATMTTFIADARFIHKDNEIGWMLIRSTPRKLANNHIIWDGIALDITEQKRAEFQLHTTLARTRVLYDVTNMAITSESLPVFLREIVQYVAQSLPADRTSLIVFDTSSKKIKHFVRGGPNADQVLLSVTYDELMEGLSGWAINTGQSALSLKDVPDPRESEAVQKRRKETNCGSVLVAPLKYQNTILGTLTLINLPEEPDFTEKDVELIEAIASQISSAIVKVTLEENLQHQNKYLATLHQLTFDLLNKLEITELLQTIVDLASDFLDAPYCEIMLHENDELAVKAYTRNQPFLENDHVGRDKALLSWKAFDTQLPVAMNDYSKWSQRREIYDDVELDAVVSLPILSKQGSIGVLELSRTKNNKEFDDFEIQAATLFAQLASLALENVKLHEALRQEAIRDPLTGLFNRRFMQESLTKEIGRAKRKEAPLAVVMFDLDHLKEINDTYGHSAGDEALRNVSLMLKTRVRTGDIACRYGGDEFTLILSDTSLENARQRMEELRKDVKQMSLQHAGKTITIISLSIGIAEYPKHGSTEQELLKAADTALYQAKQAGRNQVMTA